MDNSDDIDSYLTSALSCTSFCLDDLNNNEGLLNNEYNILTLNIRSCNANFNEFLSLLEIIKVKFPIIILTETWIKNDLDNFDIPGYVSFHSNRQGSRKGGGGQGHGLGLEPRAMESFPGVGVLWCQPGARAPWCAAPLYG